MPEAHGTRRAFDARRAFESRREIDARPDESFDMHLSRLAAEWRQPELQSNAGLLVEYAVMLTASDCGCWYRMPKGGGTAQWLTLTARAGFAAVPGRLPAEDETVAFLRECGGAAVQLTKEGPFPSLLLDERLESAAALVVAARSGEEGLLILGSRAPYAYNGAMIRVLERLGAFAGHASYRRTP
jgi:hypothetical protein